MMGKGGFMLRTVLVFEDKEWPRGSTLRGACRDIFPVGDDAVELAVELAVVLRIGPTAQMIDWMVFPLFEILAVRILSYATAAPRLAFRVVLCDRL